MKLTKAEQSICDKYSKRDENNTVHCFECPLVISKEYSECYANIDGRTKRAKKLLRFEGEQI